MTTTAWGSCCWASRTSCADDRGRGQGTALGGQLGALKAVIRPHDHHRMEELLLGGADLMR